MIRNPYVDFLKLIPKQTKWIGKVKSKRGDGYVEVQKLNTASVPTLCVCSSDVAVDKNVLVQGSTVLSALADAQPIQTVELP